MDLAYAEGNLLASGEKVILHGCNARGKFGAGFALHLARALPGAKAAYEAAFARGEVRPGEVVWAVCGGVLVGNCVTQDGYGRDGRRYADYAAIRRCMRTVNAAAAWGLPGTPFADGFDRVAMPLIGAGLAGGDWAVISRIVKEELTEAEPVVWFLPGSDPRPAPSLRR